ncbi:chromosomal replication initiation ATPase DnaA [Rhodoligotrophos appendicifer]|uniref:chromosomal replication initiator DnaA n=1 Tax=Rhodoligotrophos appendicifer TaxID=987056 RepID=UPI00118104D2|nr:chromosomal replication initiator DnaA [Rhodoligotrophos appendicifer]
MAVDAIDRWPAWRARTLVLVGPEGSGKSHLARVWRMKSGATLVTSPELTIDNVPDLSRNGAVIVEDAPFELEERALFHLINMTKENGGHLLITSRSFPAHWDIKLPDLGTRLKAVELASLQPPDDQLLRSVLVKLFGDRQLLVNDSVLEYLLMRMERSGAVAKILVNAIDRVSLERHAPVTKALVRLVLKETEVRSD